MNELGEARHTMGIRIERDMSKKILQFSKTDYIQKVLKWFHMDKFKPAPTPLPTSIWLTIRESPSIGSVKKEEMRKIPYASVVGSLMYVMVATRPNLVYVGATSRYMSNLGKKH